MCICIFVDYNQIALSLLYSRPLTTNFIYYLAYDVCVCDYGVGLSVCMRILCMDYKPLIYLHRISLNMYNMYREWFSFAVVVVDDVYKSVQHL